jgi:hypothetical protein
LFGFWPLLIGSSARWLWLVFGICNIGIAFVLVVSNCIPDGDFAKYRLLETHTHLKLYHPYLVWLLMGALSTIIGIVLLISRLVQWLIQALKRAS